ncbi:hypothetical protein QT711_03455 [Sporosarcina saromensis]|uniref:Uncharacterized protein n=1 Tax=Sporosarcina saromensis TaxID=359365 RepID=A0ABU4G5J0_9BACL|nr:hypothetical protein [Sporosarcina saromensis]MDW0112227.1 hypothetical protein [Sporosarcina saromensis]
MGKIICPHCNQSEGFYAKERVSGTATVHYTENGDWALDQSDMYASLQHSGGKRAYCNQCHKYIGKTDELKTGNIEQEYPND